MDRRQCRPARGRRGRLAGTRSTRALVLPLLGLVGLIVSSTGCQVAAPLGEIRTFGIMAVEPTDLTIGPDGALWIANFANAVGRTTLDGTSSQLFPTASASLPAWITTGPDGNLWLTGNNSTITRMTPSGGVTNFSSGDIGLPLAITSGPDGNLWFTGGFSNRIGRISPTGVVATFAGTGETWSPSITTGPDGALWFTATGEPRFGSGPRQISRITTDGVANVVVGSGVSPERITTGPDGNLWFTDDSNRIGRVTPGGTLTFFSDPSIHGPTGITSGPDGNLWFVNSAGTGQPGSLGKITPAGTVTPVSLGATTFAPSAIVAAPDGNLYVLDTSSASTILRVSTAGAVTDLGHGINGPQSIDGVPGGDTWFANVNGGSLGRVATDGTISAVPVPGVVTLGGVAAGVDGNEWYTDRSGNAVGWARADGTTARFTDPTIQQPRDIVSGSDGNLWFTNNAGNSIGRVTSAGVVSAFGGAGIAQADRISTATNGLWFTNDGNSLIGHITTAGVVSTVADPTGGQPVDVAGGAPDDSVWVATANGSGGSLVRIDPDGTTTSSVALPAGVKPSAVAVDSGGAVWVGIATSPGGLVRYDPSTGFTTYTAPGLGVPAGLARGGDGNIWFTNSGRNTIGRIGTRVPS